MFIRKNSFYIFIFVLLAFLPSIANASRAGIVIKKRDGQTKTACVTFDSSTISGWQLLEGSGFNPVSKNGFVVGIDGESSEDSSQMSSGDAFWSYWKYSGSGWLFQNVGANYDCVKDGDIEGWELGDGTCHLVNITFENICAPTAVEDMSDGAASSAIENLQGAGAASTKNEEYNAAESKMADSQTARVTESDKSNDKTPLATSGTPILTDLPPVSGSVMGAVSSDYVLSTLPNFNLKNILTLLIFFILLGIFFILVRFGVKKIFKIAHGRKRNNDISKQ